VDNYGLPIDFPLTYGEVHDNKATLELIGHLPDADFVVVDKGYDCEFIQELNRKKR
jgi:hypothetical protein